ncbi:MAG TPA: 3-hydroxyacyl-CoA dehydrogenase family protein [Azospirillum sp.]|nr:3-hydroxyacyl-CoA dehydrogenase family protein [Azospirillum sp.]
MRYTLIDTGDSRSFPAAHPLLEGAAAEGEVVVIIGRNAGAALADQPNRETKTAVLVELGTECLGVHTGESRGTEGSNVLGFARFRLGDAAPSDLVELVRQPATPDGAIAAAKAVLEGAGLKTAVCGDFAGRIIDRLVRPYYNAALRRLDEGLATADDMDLTLKLGLGYPEGPIALLERTGLQHHYDVTKALFEVYGTPDYAPARRAAVAKKREVKNASA